MQDQTLALPQWVFTVLQNLAWFGTGGLIVKFIILWQNRKRPIVEVQKTEAETTEITIRSHAAAGDSIIRLMDRLDDALDTIDRLRNERDDLREKADKLEMETESYERQMKKLKGLIDAHGISYSETDHR